MPGGGLLVGVGDAEHDFLAPFGADDLEADGELVGGEAAGDGDAADAGEVDGDGEDVGEIHLERVLCPLAELEGGRGRRGTCIPRPSAGR